MYERTRARGLRRRGEAPDHARHLRALLGLLRRLLRAGAAGPDEDRRGLRAPPSRASTSSSRRPRRRSPSSSASATDDPLAMYMSDYCTVPMSLAGIPAISIPAGLAEPDGGGPELPVGFQIAGPGVQRDADARRRATRSSGRSASTRGRLEGGGRAAEERRPAADRRGVSEARAGGARLAARASSRERARRRRGDRRGLAIPTRT